MDIGENKLMIAAAGAGKTTYLIDEALNKTDNVLITTYTIENEKEIRRKFINKVGCVPKHVTIQTWFTFLLQHGIKPYQGSFNELLFNYDIKGVVFPKGNRDKNARYISEEKHFLKYYFTKEQKIISSKLSKFVFKANETTNGKVIKRISAIYPNIFIDEIQDMAGYDLDILKLLFQCNSDVLCVGDPRQVTYHTHWELQNKGYRNGNIKKYLADKCKRIKITIDETTLNSSHRNNKHICKFSSKLYSQFEATQPCNCNACHFDDIEHQGIYLVKQSDVEDYIQQYSPVLLRYNRKTHVSNSSKCYNFGESKGKSFDRVLIYLTTDMRNWLINHNHVLEEQTRARFYVAITRARYSVAFVVPDNFSNCDIEYYNCTT